MLLERNGVTNLLGPYCYGLVGSATMAKHSLDLEGDQEGMMHELQLAEPSSLATCADIVSYAVRPKPLHYEGKGRNCRMWVLP